MNLADRMARNRPASKALRGVGMSAKIENIIFGDVSEETFGAEIWGSRAQHSQAIFSPSELFSIEELTELLRETGLIRYGTTSVGKERRDKYHPYNTEFDLSKLKSLRKLYVTENFFDTKLCFDDGRSILAHRLERFLSPNHVLRKIYNHLLAATGCIREEIIIAAFLTPPESKTFDWHVDSDHVFTFQIEGEKIWEIRSLSGDVEKYNLAPGDVLYVPADFPHRVISRDRTSLSVSYVVIPKTYVQIFTSALILKMESELEKNSIAQKPLPLYWTRGYNKIKIDKEISKIFGKLGIGEEDFFQALRDEYIDDSFSRFDDKWKPNFRYSDKILDGSSWLTKSSETPLDFVDNASRNEVVILLNGRPSLVMSRRLIDVIEFIRNNSGTFQCSELPDCYDLGDKVAICEKLLQAGILDFA
ncbi:MAG: hypothetical protein KDJ86_11120 [Bauldia sp.]|uniref:JmjC domain-containing protein n=1 Tax=Bauldia sp. TaxID=2575872 RepID=UPI001E12AA6D|nr:cupin domain-containing protein [Bauldia sp.]MCB1496330.1 hypothetical protein [Bauldia sp.]